MKLARVLAYGLVLLISGFLLFYNLDDRLLWGDEAETALLAVNITKTGLPKVTDGKNEITLYGMGIDSNADQIWIHRPFLDQYVTALSFLAFGKNTFAARFPFALVGFLTIALLAFVAYRIYNDHSLALMATLLLGTNIVFLLHARQCRYYAIIIFLQLILLYGYHRVTNRQEVSGSILISIAIIGQFYCNYVVVVANVIGIMILSLVYIRNRPTILMSSAMCMLSLAICATPWLIYAKPFNQVSVIGLQHFWPYMLEYTYMVHFYAVPLVILAIPLLVYIKDMAYGEYGKSKYWIKDYERLAWALIPSTILFLSCVSLKSMRYITPLLPVAALIIASILTYHVPRKSIRYTLFTVLCFSNIIAALTVGDLSPSILLRVPIVEFVQEISQSYQDRFSDVLAYLKQNGNPEQSVLVKDPEFPLIFYTDMRIIDFRLETPERLRELPDWILTTSASGVVEKPPLVIKRSLETIYDAINLRVHDSKRGGSVPDPRLREPFTSDQFTDMTIYRKNNHKIPLRGPIPEIGQNAGQ